MNGVASGRKDDAVGQGRSKVECNGKECKPPRPDLSIRQQSESEDTDRQSDKKDTAEVAELANHHPFVDSDDVGMVEVLDMSTPVMRIANPVIDAAKDCEALWRGVSGRSSPVFRGF